WSLRGHTHPRSHAAPGAQRPRLHRGLPCARAQRPPDPAAHRAAASTTRSLVLALRGGRALLKQLVVRADPVVDLTAVIGVVGKRSPNLRLRQPQNVRGVANVAVVVVQRRYDLPDVEPAP